MSKKRHRSPSGLDENVQDKKRIKTDLDADSEQNEIIECHSAKKKKKHNRRDATDEIPKPQDENAMLVVTDVPESSNTGSTLTETEVGHRKRSKKHKHHRHHDDIAPDELNEVTVKQELISKASANIHSIFTGLQQIDNIEESSTPKKKKKKKNRERNDDDDCVINSDVDVKQEVVDLVNDEETAVRLVNSVGIPPSKNSDIGQPERKKKKKKHHKQDDCDDTPCFVPVQKSSGQQSALTENNESRSLAGSRIMSTSHHQSSAISHINRLPSSWEKSFKRHRPAQLHTSVTELRYKPREGYKECQPADQKNCLWWEDIATDPNLELWLVRAPADFSPSILSGTRGALYDSVLIPQPERPGEGFQVSIQGVQQSKLVVLLPSKHDKKLHAASDVNGYVTVTRSEAFKVDEQPEWKASSAEELRSGLESDAGKKSKKHKRKHIEEVAVDSSRKHKKHKNSKHSID